MGPLWIRSHTGSRNLIAALDPGFDGWKQARLRQGRLKAVRPAVHGGEVARELPDGRFLAV
jgi:hypothetical protein